MKRTEFDFEIEKLRKHYGAFYSTTRAESMWRELYGFPYDLVERAVSYLIATEKSPPQVHQIGLKMKSILLREAWGAGMEDGVAGKYGLSLQTPAAPDAVITPSLPPPTAQAPLPASERKTKKAPEVFYRNPVLTGAFE